MIRGRVADRTEDAGVQHADMRFAVKLLAHT